jgi:hypothetical protein
MIGLLERITEIMGAIKTAQDSRLAEDKSQDMALAKLNKNTGVLHKQLADVQEKLGSLGTKLDDLSVRTEKHAKQVENSQSKSVCSERRPSCLLMYPRYLIQEVSQAVSQFVPQIVNQAVSRVGHQYPAQP